MVTLRTHTFALLPVLVTLSSCVRESHNSADFRAGQRPPTTVTPIPLSLPGSLATIYDALQTATTFEILSLEPIPSAAKDSTDRFHGWGVIGRVSITAPAATAKLAAALRGEVTETTAVGACFWPRHGVRVTYRSQPLDLVICYECSGIQVHLDTQELGLFHPTGMAKATLNTILDTAGIRRAPEWRRP